MVGEHWRKRREFYQHEYLTGFTLIYIFLATTSLEADSGKPVSKRDCAVLKSQNSINYCTSISNVMISMKVLGH